MREAPRLARVEGAGIYLLFEATIWRLLIFGVLSLGLVVVADRGASRRCSARLG
jgi:hypothetical protein